MVTRWFTILILIFVCLLTTMINTTSFSAVGVGSLLLLYWWWWWYSRPPQTSSHALIRPHKPFLNNVAPVPFDQWIYQRPTRLSADPTQPNSISIEQVVVDIHVERIPWVLQPAFVWVRRSTVYDVHFSIGGEQDTDDTICRTLWVDDGMHVRFYLEQQQYHSSTPLLLTRILRFTTVALGTGATIEFVPQPHCSLTLHFYHDAECLPTTITTHRCRSSRRLLHPEHIYLATFQRVYGCYSALSHAIPHPPIVSDYEQIVGRDLCAQLQQCRSEILQCTQDSTKVRCLEKKILKLELKIQRQHADLTGFYMTGKRDNLTSISLSIFDLINPCLSYLADALR